MAAGVSNGATDGLAFVAAEVVEHDDITGPQLGNEERKRCSEGTLLKPAQVAACDPV